MRWGWVGVAIAVACLAAGCQAPRAASDPPELKVGIRLIGSLDPLAISIGEQAAAESSVIRQVYEGLTDVDPVTLRVVGALAKSWTVSPDASTFTFTLRPARFHNGRAVDASDVAFSFVRLATAPCGSALSSTAGAPAYLLALVEGSETACATGGLSGVTADGPQRVVIRLKQPFADFPAVLTNPALSVVPKERVEFLRRRPIGTGPYRVVNAWDGRRLIVERFDRWWGKRPAISRVRFQGYATDAAGYRDLSAGKLHVAGVPSSRLGEARRRFGDRGLRRIGGSYFFGFNLASQRMSAKPLREALIRAVDRTSLAAGVFEHTREPARGLVPPEIPGADGASCLLDCVFSPAAARADVAETRPTGTPEIVVGVSSAGANPAVAEALAAMFAKAGVTARVLVRPFRDHVRGLTNGDMDVFQLGWVPAYPSLDALLVPLFRTGSRENHTKYSNRDVDALLDTARRTINPGVRQSLYERAERQIVDDAAVLPLSWYRTSLAFDTRLRSRAGVLVDGLGNVRVSSLRWAS